MIATNIQPSRLKKSESPKASQICPTDFSDISVVSVGIFSGKWMSISMPKKFFSSVSWEYIFEMVWLREERTWL